MAVGVFLSRSGQTEGSLDVEGLASGVASAAVVKTYGDFFDPASRTDLISTIKGASLDGVVLAGRSPRYYESTLSGQQFIEDIEAAGIDPNRISIANIHEQVGLTHGADPAGAAAKARAMIDVALAFLDYATPLETYEVAPRQSVLILGATAGGFVAAQRLLQMDFKVTIVEKTEGARKDEPFAEELGPTVSYVLDHPSASIHYGTEIADLSGWCGDYEVDLAMRGGARRLPVGGIILAASNDEDWIEHLRAFLKIDVDGQGRARTLDPRTLPVQTDDTGLVVIPGGDGGDWLHERIQAADSAVLSLAVQLFRREIDHHADVTRVDEALCGGCGSCVKTCAFGASTLDPVTHLSHVDIKRCRGCGKCVVSCPVGARDIVSSPNAYIRAAIDLLARVATDGSPKVLAFLCRGCGYTAADNAGLVAAAGGEETYPASVLPIRIPCGGRLDTQFVLQGFARGFDGVLVARCHDGQCHNLIGNVDMDRRMSLLRDVLRALSIDSERMRILDVAPHEGPQFAAAVREFTGYLAGEGGAAVDG